MARQETLLKKEFKKKDVTRARNLLAGKFGAKTTVQSGYEASEVVRKEGDIWQERGKSWTIKNGVQISISRFSKERKSIKIPLTCPNCGGPMNHHLHKESYKFYGFCLDCLVKFEDQLQQKGLYEDFVKARTENNLTYFKNNLMVYLAERLKENSNFVTSDGDIEEWEGDDAATHEKFKKNVETFLNKLG